MTVMIGKEERAASEIFPELTRDVIARMDQAQSDRLRDVMEIVIRHLHCNRQGSDNNSGRVGTGHRLPHARRQNVLREPPGAYPALGHLGHLDAR